MPTDAELMQIEIDTMWLTDARGRLTTTAEREGRPAPHLVIATATDGQRLAIGSEVPDALALQLRALIDEGVRSTDPSAPPTAIPRCIQLLELVVGPVEVASGPSYWVPSPTLYTSDADIVRSDGDSSEPLTPPDNANWSAEEWHELIDGAFGPWAIAIDGGRVVSICHSARLTDRGAEAGTWTAPGHRGRGLAAATTAAWSSLFDRTTHDLFYSTAADNHSSQNVAKRLNLRQIGWLWGLSSPRPA
ncbi:MAG: GNAT family N-acetyltransferase [Chloroflexota bacterium]|nr:GNAT family N-acetyltransferase [Chloroflexota bacterium]